MDDNAQMNDQMGEEKDEETVMPPQPDMEGGEAAPVMPEGGDSSEDSEDDEEGEEADAAA